VVKHELVGDPIELIGGDAGCNRLAALSIACDAMRPAILIFSTVSASLTSGPVNFAGAGRSTYSGRAMEAGTARRPLTAPGATLA